MTNDPRSGAADEREEILEHVPALRAFARSLTRNPTSADDLVQDAVLKAWTNFDKFTPGTNLRAWMFTILRNIFFSDRRRAKWETQDVDGIHASKVVQAATQDTHMRLRDFSRVFAQLPADQREALVLVGASGFSYEEAAEIAGVAIGTVKSRVNRGRARLAELMQLEDGETIADTDAAAKALLASQNMS